jgi:cytochrome c-type biogenesis protein CcmH/NrfG
MQQENASFWADIKHYEECLAQVPDSYLFARLAEVYLKVGLIDDALHTARQGVAKYPGYISGLRVLAMATSAKGLHDECRDALEKVIKAQPEDVESQMMLGRLLAVNGNIAAAIRSFRTVMEFNPDNVEARLELESLERNASSAEMEATLEVAVANEVSEPAGYLKDTGVAVFDEAPGEDDGIIELVHFDIVEEEDKPESIIAVTQAPAAHHDPLSTMTLAVLYEQQGFVDKALDIYRAILIDDPTNIEVQSRIASLELAEPSDVSTPPIMPEVEEETFCMDIQELPPAAAVLPVNGSADNIVAVLEGWLENVRRIKACR